MERIEAVDLPELRRKIDGVPGEVRLRIKAEDMRWILEQLEAALKRETEYKDVLERLMAGVK